MKAVGIVVKSNCCNCQVPFYHISHLLIFFWSLPYFNTCIRVCVTSTKKNILAFHSQWYVQEFICVSLHFGADKKIMVIFTVIIKIHFQAFPSSRNPNNVKFVAPKICVDISNNNYQETKMVKTSFQSLAVWLIAVCSTKQCDFIIIILRRNKFEYIDNVWYRGGCIYLLTIHDKSDEMWDYFLLVCSLYVTLLLLILHMLPIIHDVCVQTVNLLDDALVLAKSSVHSFNVMPGLKLITSKVWE